MKFTDGNTTFMYNDSGYTRCEMKYKGKTFVGETQCLAEDDMFWSERVGCYIAECKAHIKVLKYKRAQIRAKLDPLMQLERGMKANNNYNPKSYEARYLQGQIRMFKEQLAVANTDIALEEQNLFSYIQNKEIMYKKYRKGQN